MYMQDEYEVFVKWFESQSRSREAPSIKYRRADRIRRKDLAFEYGGYERIAPTIALTDIEQEVASSDFREKVNNFRRSQGWEVYT